jgi:hypothetical protein
MSTVPTDKADIAGAEGVLGKLWRESSRPFRRWTNRRRVAATAARRAAREARLQAPEPGLHFSVQAGTVEPAGLAFLTELLNRSRAFPGPIIEIGTLFGRTTTHLALNKAPEQKIITVDTYTWNPWGLSNSTYHQITSMVLSYLVQSGHVEQLKMDKNKFYENYNGPSPSLVFLDAIHTYEETKKDIEWAKAVGAALISGHDYSYEFPGVQQVVHEFGGPRETGGTVFLL